MSNWVVLLGAAFAIVPPSPTFSADAIPVNVRELRIPFTFDAADLSRNGGVAIDLFVSRDGGDWQLAESELPGQSYFDYSAPEDGTYAFCVRARTATGQLVPAGPLTSGMTVRVDRTPPSVRVACRPTGDGVVEVEWSVESADVATIRLQTTAAGGASRDLPVGGQMSGRIQCAAQDVARCVATVTDAAGNTATVTATPMRGSGRDSISQAAASNALPNAPLSLGEPGVPVYEDAPPVAASSEPQSVAPAGMAAPLAEGRGTPVIPASLPRVTSSSSAAQPPAPQWSPPPTSSHGTASALPSYEHGTRPGQSPHGRQEATPNGPRVLATRGFRLNYVLDDIGTSGVAKVSTYITEDGGKSWFLYGEDADRQSPVEVRVPADGDYGFSFRVTSGVGLVSPPPQPGERPEVEVTVDTTAPTLTLQPATLLSGGTPQEVLIRWDLDDAHLATGPITVSVSGTPDGPWRPVAESLADSGRHHWRVPQPAPPLAYFRIEAIDAAGNRSTAVSEKPLALDASRPRARVTEIDPIPVH